MRKEALWIAITCGLPLLGLLPAFSSGGMQSAGKERVIYSFQGGTDGVGPTSDLTVDATGNLYGTTSRGGIRGCGTVFELKRTKQGWEERLLYSFQGGSDGAFPVAGVIFDNNGNLYGTTSGGGSIDGSGTVFELSPNPLGQWTESVIHRFSFYGKPGREPRTDLIRDSHGNLYGTTNGGPGGRCSGDYGCGAVFELIPGRDSKWTAKVLHTFGFPPDGGNPSSAPIFDGSGNIYGATTIGGKGWCRPNNDSGKQSASQGCGTIYELTPKATEAWNRKIIYSFRRGGGYAVYPSGGLLFDDAGHLFGTSIAGGNGMGTVFELDQRQPGRWKQAPPPHLFYGNPDGGSPLGRLVMNNGAIFGVTRGGGSGAQVGVVFVLERNNSGWKQEVLHGFGTGTDGINPQAGLVSGPDGHLYGTTQNGGNTGCGTVYEVIP